MLENLNQNKIYKFFEEISCIPRGSGNEKEISDYLVNFAKDRNLRYIQDEINNVIIYKDSTGKSQEPIILQGHMDMVCEKNSKCSHDFLKDGLKLKVDGDFIHATDTTLGADNGIAVAINLAILDDNTLIHPPIEAVFTVDEETGMTGVKHLEPKNLKGRTLINIDNEDDQVCLVSCAGGMRANVSIEYKTVELPKQYSTYTIEVSGLKGGHSGADIHLERANSNVIMARIINELMENIQVYIIEIQGGSKDNAIPREAKCKISIKNDVDIDKILADTSSSIKNEYRENDPNMEIKWTKNDNVQKGIDIKDSENIISAILLLPNGVINMSQSIENLVETSSNIGVVEQSDDKITIKQASRSSLASRKMMIKRKISQVAKVIDAEVVFKNEYPAWEYNPSSRIREIYVNTYKNIYGVEPKIEALHAGLECGTFNEKFPNMDMISIGPNLYDVHTPDEKASITSIDKIYKILIELLDTLGKA